MWLYPADSDGRSEKSSTWRKQCIFYFIWRTCCPAWRERGTKDLVQREGGGVGVLFIGLLLKATESNTFFLSLGQRGIYFNIGRDSNFGDITESSDSNLIMTSIGQKNPENLMLAQINFCWPSVELRQLFSTAHRKKQSKIHPCNAFPW